MLKLQLSAAVLLASLLLTPFAFADDDKKEKGRDRDRDDDRKSYMTTSSNASTSALQAQIAELKKMLDNLMNQRKSSEDSFKKQQDQMKDQQKDIQKQIESVQQELRFNRSLSRGLSGDDVRDLQELLAQDPDIFDAASVTGYFGPKTEKALKKWQKKHGISAIGIFGPASQAKLLALFAGKPLPPGIAKKLGVHFGSSTPGTGFVTVCHNGQNLVLPVPALGAHLSHGDTLGFCAGTATTTPPNPTDTTAPVISNVGVSGIASTSATLNWNVNEAATGKVYMGTSSPVNLATAIVTNTSASLNHSIGFSGLNSGTTYYFLIVAKDASGNTSTSTQASFATASVDTSAPIISGASVSGISSTSASIGWNTNENATGKVYYSTATPINFGSASTLGTTTLSTGHSFTLFGLNASTTYYFVLESKDALGNTSTTSQSSFNTTN